MHQPIIYFTDNHVNKYTQFNEHRDRLKDCLLVINDAFKFADEYESDTILFGGDFGDLPKFIYIVVLNAIMQRLRKLFKAYPHIKMYAISGNHDFGTKNLIDKPGESLLTTLATAFPDNFILIDNSFKVFAATNTCVMGIPFYEHPEHYSIALDNAVATVAELQESYPGLKVTLMIHQTPEGIYNTHIKTDTSPADPRYKAFSMVLCGHIHKKQRINNRFLIGGNPLHRDLGDIGDEKGMWVMDMAMPVKTLEFLTRKGRYPEFIRVKQDKITDEMRRNSFIVPDMDTRLVTVEGAASETMFSSNLTIPDLLTNFWKEVDVNKDEKLLKVGLELCDL